MHNIPPECNAPLELLIWEMFEGTNKIKITVDRDGIFTSADSSDGFCPYEDIEEFGVIECLYDALAEAWSGVQDSRREPLTQQQ